MPCNDVKLYWGTPYTEAFASLYHMRGTSTKHVDMLCKESYCNGQNEKTLPFYWFACDIKKKFYVWSRMPKRLDCGGFYRYKSPQP